MNLNLDGSSPWFHVHFTLPNQTNKRSEVKYDSERKRIKELIQSKDAFLAPTSKRNTHRSIAKPVKHSREEFRKKLGKETTRNFALRRPWFNQNGFKKSGDAQRRTSAIDDRMCIDAGLPNTTKPQDRKSIFPPLQGNKTGSIVCCPGQREDTAETKTDNNEVKETDQESSTREVKSENKLSIADCYDLCNWKPQNSLCRESRPLVGILKQNTGIQKQTLRPQGQSSILLDNSESSGNETENETTKRNKKVRFAKGTNFSQSSKNRKYKTKRIDLDELDELSGDENNLEDMIELSFREFIRRKRLERSKVMAEISKDSNMLCFLKDENKLPKVNTKKQQKTRSKNNGDQEDCQSKVDTMLPTVVN